MTHYNQGSLNQWTWICYALCWERSDIESWTFTVIISNNGDTKWQHPNHSRGVLTLCGRRQTSFLCRGRHLCTLAYKILNSSFVMRQIPPSRISLYSVACGRSRAETELRERAVSMTFSSARSCLLLTQQEWKQLILQWRDFSKSQRIGWNWKRLISPEEKSRNEKKFLNKYFSSLWQ